MVIKKWYEEWVVDDRYFCTVRLSPSDDGEWKWGFFDTQTWVGRSEWSRTIEQAHEQVAAMLKNAQDDNKVS